jgi:hypothetical protein
VRKFLSRLVLLLIPILLFTIGYEFFLRKTNTPNIYSYKDGLLENQYEGIVFGNSHALRGIVSENLDYHTINLSNVSQSISIDKIWLEEVVKLKAPKFIILTVSIPTLTSNLFESKENWRIKNYNLYTRLQLSYKPKYNFEFLNGSQKENFLKAYALLTGKKGIDENYLKKGSFPFYEISSNLEKEASVSSKRHSANIHNLSKNKYTIEEIIQLSMNTNFEVVIVTPPAHKFYRDLIPIEIKNNMYYFLSEIESNNENVHWLNYFESTEFSDNTFKDADHLNFNGATLLTEKINFFLQKHYTL